MNTSTLKDNLTHTVQWAASGSKLIYAAIAVGLIVGLILFSFLIIRGAVAAVTTRRMLVRSQKRRGSDPLRLVMSERDRFGGNGNGRQSETRRDLAIVRDAALGEIWILRSEPDTVSERRGVLHRAEQQ